MSQHTPDTTTRIRKGMGVATCTRCSQELYFSADGWTGDDNTTTCPVGQSRETAEQIEARQRDEDAAYRQAAVAQYGPTPTAAERVSEPSTERVTGGKTERTERVRTSELTAGDVIEYDSGVRETVLATGETGLVGALHYRQVTLATAQNPAGIRCKLQTGARWDRLTEQAKRELGYPVADVDVPSEREPRGQVFWDGSCRYCNRYQRACGRNHVSEEREHVIGAHDVAALRRALAGDGDLHALITAILNG